MTTPRLNAVTLGVSDFARSVRFYQDLGFKHRFKATGDEIAFFDAGGMVLSLFRWDALAEDAQLPA
jgi:catechol 2,3-dioxygenase-like lactoylglutathione lyase family enzyme